MTGVPGDLVQLGTVPEWVAAAIAARAVYGPIGRDRLRRAVEWAEQLLDLTGLSAEQLAATLDQSEQLTDLVATAWDAGSRAVNDSKRRLLALAAAAGIVGDENVSIDDLPLFVRTLDQVDAIHMKLLILLGEPVRQEGEALLSISGGTPTGNLVARWPAIEDTVDPLMALLNREGLIRDVSIPGGIGHTGPEWRMSPYGERFVLFVNAGAPELRQR
jgi:hypothetical protein